MYNNFWDSPINGFLNMQSQGTEPSSNQLKRHQMDILSISIAVVLFVFHRCYLTLNCNYYVGIWGKLQSI